MFEVTKDEVETGRRLGLPYLLLVVVAVVVDAVVEAVSRRHPLLLHQALEAMLGPTVGVAHHLHQAGHHAANVPVFCLWSSRGGGDARQREALFGWEEFLFICLNRVFFFIFLLVYPISIL